ncbi:MAG: 50S ribosomal protein L1 [Myxococcales bacterium]|nr:50S ribosomal protein L1 [Myxococcales bacterium]
MARRGKKYRAAAAQVDPEVRYKASDAVELVKKVGYAKFDETIDVAVNLNVDPRHADQMVRGAVVMPHGTGTTIRVLVFAEGEKAKEAEEAGADFVGSKDLVEKIKGGWLEFDKTIATPDQMRYVGPIGRILGPRKLMPNPKVGTVTMDVGRAVSEMKAGRVEFRVDKAGIIHSRLGKKGFTNEQLLGNLKALVDNLWRLKPASAKGRYFQSLTLSPSMGPGVKVDTYALLDELRVV